MATFLTTTQLNAELEQLIRQAKRRLWLITPYVQVGDRLMRDLADVDSRSIEMCLLFGKGELKPEEKEKLASLRTLETRFLNSLHGKCYLNEEVAVVTSMNLYHFSQSNNDEMGILVSRKEDPQLFADVWAEAQRLFRVADRIHEPSQAPASTRKPKKPPRTAVGARAVEESNDFGDAGHCLRCKKEIAFDPERPYCIDHYREWKQWEDVDYQDPYCHDCGERTGATMAKPLCRACYKAYQAS